MVRGLIATLVVVMALAASVTRTRAGTVAITFDRDAVRELLVAGLPPPSRIRVPGVAEFLLRLDAPDAVRFSSGGLETRVPFLLDPVGLGGTLDVRYVPEVPAGEGSVLLVPERAMAEGIPFDLTPYLPVIRLPQETGWRLPREDGDVDVVVRTLEVRFEPQYLLVKFDLVARPAASAP
jgi:hypothetical protein